MLCNMWLNDMKLNLLGPYIFAPEVHKERIEVYKYYNFYYGKSTAENNNCLNEFNQGQSWSVSADLDFIPTQEIRNHTKRLIKRQARFMFGVSPTIMFKGYDKKDNEVAERLRQFIDKNIFDKNEFWKDTFKAFLDCTICKRVLLRVEANPGEPITLHYHTMDEFTFEVDPKNYKRLMKVTIAYLSKDTDYKAQKEQVWHRWQYVMKEDGYCYLTSGVYDGYCAPIEEEKEHNTMLTEIPCRVIINDGLLGDLHGSSDIRDLIDMQTSYNKTNSDFRDALKFKMFEQPVFIDATEDSTEDIKIAPNAMIELHSDHTLGENSKADAKMLSSSFSFAGSAKQFADDIKTDMYELMDQPKPEDLKALTSGKALKFSFYDLMSRCDEKWIEWEGAITWLINFCIYVIKEFNLYPDQWENEFNDIDFKIVITHNYPIPEDIQENKELGLREVESNVRSVKSYIKEISDEEDYETEYKTILQEKKDFNDITEDTMERSLKDERTNIMNNNSDDSSEDDDSDNDSDNDNDNEDDLNNDNDESKGDKNNKKSQSSKDDK